MADYPTSIPTFDEKFDYRTVIFADHVNKLQNELLATQNTLGSGVLTSSGWVGTFSTTSTTWATLKARLQNMDYGIEKAFNERVNTRGGSTITSSTVSVVGLVFQAIASQTAPLTEWKNSGGTVVSYVTDEGELHTYSQQVVPIVYAGSQPSSVPVGTIWVDSSTEVSTLNFQGVVPDGGTQGQVLTKTSATDYDYDWEDIVIPEPGFNPFLLGGM